MEILSFSVKTLKKMKLQCLPTTKDGIIKKAKRESWAYSRIKVFGGEANKYSFNSMPDEVREAIIKYVKSPKTIINFLSMPEEIRTAVIISYLQSPTSMPNFNLLPEKVKKEIAVKLSPEVRMKESYESLWRWFARKPQKAKEKAKWQLMVLHSVEDLVENGVDGKNARIEVGEKYGVDQSTIWRWQKKVDGYDKKDWLPALCRSGKNGRGESDFSQEAWEVFKGDYLRLEKPSITACYNRLVEANKNNGYGWEIPSIRTVQRCVKERIPVTIKILKREGEKKLKRIYPAQKRDKSNLRAMQWINGDGYTHNVFVKWPMSKNDIEVLRPKTWFWQDVYSNKILAWRTDITENSDLIRLSFLDVCDDFGIPEEITIDNTRAAANKWMTGGVKHRFRYKVKEDDPLGVFPSLGCEVHWATPEWGQAKPVERAFGIGGIGEYVDKDTALSGAWCGSNTNAKPENYGKKAVDIDTFLDAIKRGVQYYNTIANRKTDVCAGVLSYQEAFEQSFKNSGDSVRKIVPEQRMLMLLTAEGVRVTNEGTFTLDAGKGFGVGSNRYGSDVLYDWARKKIIVRFDPQDLHGCVWCYSLDNRFLCEASCIFAAGFGDTEKAREHNRQRRKMIKATKEAAKAQNRMSVVEAAEKLNFEPDDDGERLTRVIRPIYNNDNENDNENESGSDSINNNDNEFGNYYEFDENLVNRFLAEDINRSSQNDEDIIHDSFAKGVELMKQAYG